MRGLGQVVHILMLPFCMMPYISTVFVAQSGATFDEAFGMVHMHVDDEDAGSQYLIMTHEEVDDDVEAVAASMVEYNSATHAADPFAAALVELPSPDTEVWILFDGEMSDYDYRGLFATLSE